MEHGGCLLGVQGIAGKRGQFAADQTSGTRIIIKSRHRNEGYPASVQDSAGLLQANSVE